MGFHWKVLAWMAAGALVGMLMQALLAAPAYTGLVVASEGDHVRVVSIAKGSPASARALAPGARLAAAIVDRGTPDEVRVPLDSEQALAALLDVSENGAVLWMVPHPAPTGADPAAGAVALALGMDPESPRAIWLAPFEFAADIFLALLKMLIVPIVLTSIINGITGIGSMADLRRLGGKTFGYYMTTSLLAILVGQVLVNLIRPGDGARLGLSPASPPGTGTDDSFIAVLKRMVPENIFGAMQDNGAMLSIIFFALLFGFFITRTDEPHRGRVRGLFESLFEVVMRMAQGVLTLLPYGVFALIVKVVASTGFAPFKALLLFMVTVLAALVIHAAVTLPILLKTVGRVSPTAWFKAMSPALMTAFSTSSSSMTLPVNLRTVEHRGRVSNKVTSFVLPLGATINMDGTALYECIGVIFLAQYYAGAGGYELTLGGQALVVILALLASVGAAGIPSAGLVMMLTILAALDLPVEGAALLLAIDRPLDMLRTVVNVWSDSCGAAVIARSEGEDGPLNPVGGV